MCVTWQSEVRGLRALSVRYEGFSFPGSSGYVYFLTKRARFIRANGTFRIVARVQMDENVRFSTKVIGKNSLRSFHFTVPCFQREVSRQDEVEIDVNHASGSFGSESMHIDPEFLAVRLEHGAYLLEESRI
jgi:hypothetical protein